MMTTMMTMHSVTDGQTSTDGRTDGQTDDILMQIANHTVQQYDGLKSAQQRTNKSPEAFKTLPRAVLFCKVKQLRRSEIELLAKATMFWHTANRGKIYSTKTKNSWIHTGINNYYWTIFNPSFLALWFNLKSETCVLIFEEQTDKQIKIQNLLGGGNKRKKQSDFSCKTCLGKHLYYLNTFDLNKACETPNTKMTKKIINDQQI